MYVIVNEQLNKISLAVSDITEQLGKLESKSTTPEQGRAIFNAVTAINGFEKSVLHDVREAFNK